MAVHTSFISLPRPLPLGEVDANAVSRRRGRARCPSEHARLLKRFILYFFRSAVQSFRNFFDFSQKCNDFFRKIGYTVSCRDSGAATTSPHMIPPHTKAIPQTRTPSGVPQAPEGVLVVSLFFQRIRSFAANTESTTLGFTCAPSRCKAASARRTACRACVPCTGARGLLRRPAAATARKSVSRAAAAALSFS